MINKTNKPEAEKVQLTLYIRGSCPFCKKVLKYLKSAGETVPLKDVGSHPEYKEELIKIGGKQQVPCLVIDGTPLYESDEIIHYLQRLQNSQNRCR